MANVTVTVRASGLTVERIVHRRQGRYLPGLVEAVYAANPGLADSGPVLAVGTSFVIPDPDATMLAAAVDVIRLTD